LSSIMRFVANLELAERSNGPVAAVPLSGSLSSHSFNEAQVGVLPGTTMSKKNDTIYHPVRREMNLPISLNLASNPMTAAGYRNQT
jgi:hypothetical protein